MKRRETVTSAGLADGGPAAVTEDVKRWPVALKAGELWTEH
jgi:hypothetical protein